MTEIQILITHISSLLEQPMPPMVELRKALLELDELINGADFQSLDSETRSSLQGFRKELKKRLNNGNSEAKLSPVPTPSSQMKPVILPAVAQIEPWIDEESLSPQDPQTPLNHKPVAEEPMEEAEKAFYSGRYSEAIKLFDRVLQLEPKWERARQHRSEAENYLRTGYIPPVALPAEAASAFGKAQSAARVGRYADALNMLTRAQTVLREVGIQRWQEGLEFEQKLQENLDAENVYKEGLKLFDQGQVDEAIDRMETAGRATGLPKYNDRAQQMRRFKESLRSVHDALSNLSPDPKAVAQAKADLERLGAEHGDNPVLDRLRSRLENTLPRTLTPLKEQARTLKSQAEHAETIGDSLHQAQQARMVLDQIRNLEPLDESMERTQAEVDRLLRDTQKAQNDMELARKALEDNPRWPVQAAHLSQPIREKYPNDPLVTLLQRDLGRFFILRMGIRVGIVIAAILLLALIGWFSLNRFEVYQLSRTPSATPTATNTATGTPTPTATMTSTATPSLTPSPSPTPTPISAMALRDIWARNGCYETFTATGRIPAGGQVFFLSAERRFDSFNRECALVEYRWDSISIIGWILLMDIGPAE